MGSSAPGIRRNRTEDAIRPSSRPVDANEPRASAHADELSWVDAPPLEADAMIEEMYTRASSTFYALLGVPNDATAAVIAKAHADLGRRFDPKNFAGRVSTRRMFQVEFIARTLKGAFLTLTEPARRIAYDAAIERDDGSSDDLKASGVTARISAHTPPPRSTRPPIPANDRSLNVREEGPRRAVDAPPSTEGSRPRVIVTDGVNPVPPPRRDVPVGEPGSTASLLRVAREERGPTTPRRASPTPTPTPRRAPPTPPPRAADPDEATARRHEGAKQWKLAVAAWRGVCARHPNDVDAHLGLIAAACEGHLELNLASDHARIAERLAPDSADAAVARARVMLLQGSVAGAKGAVQRALSLNPEHPVARDLARRLKV